MKKLIYLASFLLVLGFSSCQEVKNDAAQVEEGVEEAAETMTDQPLKEIEEGMEEAGETMSEEPLEQVEEGFEEAGQDLEEEVEEIVE